MVLLMLKFSSCLIRGSQIVAFQGTDNTESINPNNPLNGKVGNEVDSIVFTILKSL